LRFLVRKYTIWQPWKRIDFLYWASWTVAEAFTYVHQYFISRVSTRVAAVKIIKTQFYEVILPHLYVVTLL
jgi:hypothetical protein